MKLTYLVPIILFFVACTNKNAKQQPNGVTDNIIQDVAVQEPVNGYYEILMAWLDSNKQSGNYPDYFGGTYINDKGQLVV